MDLGGRAGRRFPAGNGLAAGKWRNLVLQLGQLGGNFLAEQILASGQQLAKLNKNRPQLFQSHPQRHSGVIGFGWQPKAGHEPGEEMSRKKYRVSRQQTVQPIAAEYIKNLDDSKQSAHRKSLT